MEQLQFNEVKQLLNACRLIKVAEKASHSAKGKWDLYEAAYVVHVNEFKFNLLYLQSDARMQDLSDAKKCINSSKYYVVFAPSIRITPKSINEVFSGAEGVWSTPDYLRSFMASELKAYRDKLIEDSPQDYISPSFTVPSGVIKRYPNPIENFLKAPAYKAESDNEGSLAVVLGEAGHGKTYMCQWLVARLAKDQSGVLPIYVNSSQWKLLRHEDLISLERTLVSSFRAIGTPIPWVDGQEDLFLKVALKAGLFKIIFDGFDEYVLKSPSEIDANIVFNALSNLALETGTKIVITSRSSFWHSELAVDIESNQEKFHDTFDLQPFGSDKAKEYFEIKFGSDLKKVDAAVTIFNELNKNDTSFAGRGFVLRLISDLVSNGYKESRDQANEKPLISLIKAHCERDKVRQELEISSDEQIDSIENFIFETLQGEENSTETLEYSIKTVVPSLDNESVRKLLGKMAPHALIVNENNKWRVRQQQVQIALLADKLIKLSETQQYDLLKTFSKKAKIDLSQSADIASMIVSLIRWNRTPDDAFEKVKFIIKVFFESSDSHLDSLKNEFLRVLSTSLAFRTLETIFSGLSQKEKADHLSSIFPYPKFQGVILHGGISKLDLSDQEFEKCYFDNVRWANCRFSNKTKVINCKIIGGSETYCNGIENIEFINPSTDVSGKNFIETIEITHGKRKYTDDHLKRDIFFALEQFMGKGGVGFKSVEQSLYGRSRITSSKHKKTILEEMKNKILQENHVSTATRIALSIHDDAKDSVKVLITNNMLSGQVLELFNALKSKLID